MSVAGLQLVAFGLFCVSCGAKTALPVKSPENFRAVNAAPRPLIARTADSVEVFTRTRPARSIREVGIWYYSGEFEGEIQQIREEAAVVGCDGVIVTNEAVGHTTESYYPRYHTSSGTERWYDVVCVVYTDVPTSYRPPAHPCVEKLEVLSQLKSNGTKVEQRKALRSIPSECFLLNPPKVKVLQETSSR